MHCVLSFLITFIEVNLEENSLRKKVQNNALSFIFEKKLS